MIKSTNKNLVIVRTGQESEHLNWTETPEGRSFDIIVLTYIDPEKLDWDNKKQDKIEYEPGEKLGALHAWLSNSSSIFEQYEYIMLVDDGIRTNHRDINRLFNYTKMLSLEISQPSLSPDSYYSLAITKSHRSFLHRWTNGVEALAPIFKSQTLAKCLPTFGINPNGEGNIEALWNQHCSHPIGSIAVIDKITVDQIRRAGTLGSGVAGNTNYMTPHYQQRMISTLTCACPQFNNICALKADGKFLHMGDKEFIDLAAQDVLVSGLEQHPKMSSQGTLLHRDDIYRSYINELILNYEAISNCNPLPDYLDGLGLTSTLSAFHYQELNNI